MVKRFLITGYYGFNNFGDDLFPYVCAQVSERFAEQVEIHTLSPRIPNVKARYVVPDCLSAFYRSNGAIGSVVRLLFMIYGALVFGDVVLAGGSTLSSGSSNRMRKLQYYLAKFKVCKLYAIGVSVGPFISENDKSFARKFINKLNFLSVRDEYSLAECNLLGVKVPVENNFDLVGAIKIPSFLKKERKSLGLSICNYETFVGGDLEEESSRNEAIFNGVLSFLELNKDYKAKIVVLNSNNLLGDQAISEKLKRFLQQNNQLVDLVSYSNCVDTFSEISSCQIYMSVRLHGGVVAYLQNVPFVLVEYHRKCRDFLTTIGKDDSARLRGWFGDRDVVNVLNEIKLNREKYAVAPEDYRIRALKNFEFM